VSKFVRTELEIIKAVEEHSTFDSVIRMLVDNTYTQEEWNDLVEIYTELEPKPPLVISAEDLELGLDEDEDVEDEDEVFVEDEEDEEEDEEEEED